MSGTRHYELPKADCTNVLPNATFHGFVLVAYIDVLIPQELVIYTNRLFGCFLWSCMLTIFPASEAVSKPKEANPNCCCVVKFGIENNLLYWEQPCVKHCLLVPRWEKIKITSLISESFFEWKKNNSKKKPILLWITISRGIFVHCDKPKQKKICGDGVEICFIVVWSAGLDFCVLMGVYLLFIY